MTRWLCLCPQLNIYTPLPQSAQAHFVPESPGVIQSGLTTARESILPFVQAVQVFRFDVCIYSGTSEYIKVHKFTDLTCCRITSYFHILSHSL